SRAALFLLRLAGVLSRGVQAAALRRAAEAQPQAVARPDRGLKYRRGNAELPDTRGDDSASQPGARIQIDRCPERSAAIRAALRRPRRDDRLRIPAGGG